MLGTCGTMLQTWEKLGVGFITRDERLHRPARKAMSKFRASKITEHLTGQGRKEAGKRGSSVTKPILRVDEGAGIGQSQTGSLGYLAMFFLTLLEKTRALEEWT